MEQQRTLERGGSIRRKVMSVVLVTTLVALLINGLGLAALDLKSYRDSQLAGVRTQADIVARASAAAVAFNDRKEANEALRLLRENRDVFAAAVYLQNGNLFAAYERQPGSVPPSWPTTDGFSFHGDRIKGFRRVVEEGTAIGAVYLDVEYRLYERVLQFSGILVAVLLAALVLAVSLSTALQRSVTKPIQDITEAARRVIERHDYSVRAPHGSRDETGVLADAFNQMLAEIDRRSAEVAAEMRDRRQAEEALRLADKRKDEFLATLAHELRNPLAPIRSSVHLLKLKGSREEVDRSARDIIDRQVGHMSRLLDDLLDVGRITGHKLELRRQTVTLASVLDAAIETSKPLIDAGSLALRVSLPGESIPVNGDPVRLCQIFSNLLNNAAKYTPAGGEVTLCAEAAGGEVAITIRDNGVGIAPENLRHIFQLFSQAVPARERSQGGLGIGLFLVKAFVELHGGTVTARSAGAGRGTEIEVRLPLAPARSAHPAAAGCSQVSAAPDS